MFAVRKLLIPLTISAIFGMHSMPAWAGQGIKIEKVGVGTQVKVTRSGSVVRLKEGDPLQSGDELSTDEQTAVDVRLDDDTLIRVGVSSTYKVEESSKFLTLVHRLITGVVRIQVPKAENKGSEIKFRLYTPEGTIGVRGTEFVVIRTSEGTELKGLAGEVLFGGADADFAQADKFVQVRRGFQSMVKAGGAASKPEKFVLEQYLQQINGRSGVFGPLSGRTQPPKVYARASTGASAPAAAPVAQASAPKGQQAKAPSGNVGGGSSASARTNWDKKLFEGVLDADLAKVKEALKNGADVNATQLGHTPLQIAVMESKEKDQEIMAELLMHCADPNVKSKGLTLLMFIAKNKLDLEYAKIMVEPGGADYKAKDKNGNTAADYAADSGFKELEDYLLSEEAEKDSEDALLALKKNKRCNK